MNLKTNYRGLGLWGELFAYSSNHTSCYGWCEECVGQQTPRGSILIEYQGILVLHPRACRLETVVRSTGVGLFGFIRIKNRP